MGQVQLQPYSVTRGQEETNWWAELTILKELQKKGQENWTDEEREKVQDLEMQACSWVTCACGNMCDIIPRDGGGSPLDEKLDHLGVLFSQYIDEHNLDVDKAVKTLEKIEKRSEKLIKSILKKQLKNNE